MPACGIPRGVYIPSLKMFHVSENKGKTFSNGGFGTALPKELHLLSSKEKGSINLYLWVEEALCLHDSGLADFVSEDELLLNTQQLYLLLQEGGIALAVYRVYAHLRNQTFRVLRYNSSIDEATVTTTTTTDDEDPLKVRTVLPPPPPSLEPFSIAWQVYRPNANFRKTNPGQPDFLVAITSYALPSPSFQSISSLLTDCKDIPLKVAAVSDSGTVVMFGLTDFGVPDISRKGKEETMNGDTQKDQEELIDSNAGV